MWEQNTVYTKKYGNLPVDKREIFRYARSKGQTAGETRLLDECLPKAEAAADMRVCFGFFGCKVSDGCVRFPFSDVRSQDLSRILNGCECALIFAATVGPGIDRLIMRYSRLSPSRALMYQAIGAERAEALCDAFCAEIGAELELTARFSPGYGDLDLCTQRIFLSALNSGRLAGITLGESLLMSPSKSVTAVCGVKNGWSYCE